MLKQVLGTLSAIIFGLSLFSIESQANVSKGQKIIIKKLKKPCGFNGGILAKKHTQDEWTAIQNEGRLNAEIAKLCPKAKPLKDKYIPHVYDFLNNYASDSGNVPSC
jgi:hypothetical protein